MKMCEYLVIQMRSSVMNDIFGLAGTFVTWDSKQISVHKLFWLHGGPENLKKYTMVLKSLPPSMIRAIYTYDV